MATEEELKVALAKAQTEAEDRGILDVWPEEIEENGQKKTVIVNYVLEKKPLAMLKPGEVVPEEIDGIETKVRVLNPNGAWGVDGKIGPTSVSKKDIETKRRLVGGVRQEG